MVKDHLFIWVPSCGTLPIGIKDAISLTDFKERIKSWDKPCDCPQWN